MFYVYSEISIDTHEFSARGLQTDPALTMGACLHQTGSDGHRSVCPVELCKAPDSFESSPLPLFKVGQNY